MHPALAQVIATFRSAQDLAVMTLRDRLGVALPESNREWAKVCHGLDYLAKERAAGGTASPAGRS